eukprot:403364614
MINSELIVDHQPHSHHHNAHNANYFINQMGGYNPQNDISFSVIERRRSSSGEMQKIQEPKDSQKQSQNNANVDNNLNLEEQFVSLSYINSRQPSLNANIHSDSFTPPAKQDFDSQFKDLEIIKRDSSIDDGVILMSKHSDAQKMEQTDLNFINLHRSPKNNSSTFCEEDHVDNRESDNFKQNDQDTHQNGISGVRNTEEQNKVVKQVMDSFECVDAFVVDKSALENAIVAVNNTNSLGFQSLNCSIDDLRDYEDQPNNGMQGPSLKDNIMQKLTNLRFRFNDGDLFKLVAYPEVDFTQNVSPNKEQTSSNLPQLFEKIFTNREDFEKAFKDIIWVSYRNNFQPLKRYTNQEESKQMLHQTQAPTLKDQMQMKPLNSLNDTQLPQLKAQNLKYINSDCGWGCMIRCQQMMLANSFLKLLQQNHNFHDILTHDSILSMILDQLDAPFGIHQITEEGRKSMNKQPGDCQNDSELFKKLGFLAFQEGVIVLQDIKDELIKGFKMKNEEQKSQRISLLTGNSNPQQNQNSKDQIDFQIDNNNSNIQTGTQISQQQHQFMSQSQVKQSAFEGRKLSSSYVLIDEPSLDVIDEKLKDEESYQKIEVTQIQAGQFDPNNPNLNSSTLLSQIIDYNQLLYNYEGTYPRSLMIIMTIRLGLENIEQDYHKALKACFSLRQCVGILGGKPNFALYFVGYQQDHMIFLDPHYVQQALTSDEQLKDQELKDTYQSQRSAKKIKMESLDPCIGVGFLIQNSKDLIAIERAFQSKIDSPAKNNGSDNQQSEYGILKDLGCIVEKRTQISIHDSSMSLSQSL